MSLVSGAGGWRPLGPADVAQSSADLDQPDDAGPSMASSAPKAPQVGQAAEGEPEDTPALDEAAAAVIEGSGDVHSGAEDDDGDDDWEEQLEAAAQQEKRKRCAINPRSFCLWPPVFSTWNIEHRTSMVTNRTHHCMWHKVVSTSCRVAGQEAKLASVGSWQTPSD